MIKNYYQLLDLNKNVKPEEVKKAFRFYASKYHPDKHGGDKFFEEKFKEINEAYDVLSNPVLKKKYDEELFGIPKQEEFFKQKFRQENSNSYERKKSSNHQETNREREFQAKKSQNETPEQKEKKEIAERRMKDFLIGIGTAFMVFFIFSAFGDNGMHVPIAMFFFFWTIRQIFVVLISFLSD